MKSVWGELAKRDELAIESRGLIPALLGCPGFLEPVSRGLLMSAMGFLRSHPSFNLLSRVSSHSVESSYNQFQSQVSINHTQEESIQHWHWVITPLWHPSNNTMTI